MPKLTEDVVGDWTPEETREAAQVCIDALTEAELAELLNDNAERVALAGWRQD